MSFATMWAGHGVLESILLMGAFLVLVAFLLALGGFVIYMIRRARTYYR